MSALTKRERNWLGDQGQTQIEAKYDLLEAIARRFVDSYDGDKAAMLGNGAARRAHDEFRALLDA